FRILCTDISGKHILSVKHLAVPLTDSRWTMVSPCLDTGLAKRTSVNDVSTCQLT
ncbi:hypothetical protein BgiBS90_007973, partial [Biomphalaria glabrata]